jgi:hypothetical protein
MCQEEQFQAIRTARDGHHVLSARKRGIFPSRHRLQRLALGAATRQRDGHNAEFIYC